MAEETVQDVCSTVLNTGVPQLIDLSVSLKGSGAEPDPPRIRYLNHKKTAWLMGLGAVVAGKKTFGERLIAVLRYLAKGKWLKTSDFPQGMSLAWEVIKVHTHCGTHLDAPWHYGPSCEGRPAKTIDQVPLQWCYSNGVRLDLTHKLPGSLITVEDLRAALSKIEYQLEPLDIVLIHTNADKHYEQEDYLEAHPGMSREATLWLLEQGIKIVGVDAFGFDRPFKKMIDDYWQSKDAQDLWPAHLVGREKEYCHIERMANLDKIPRSSGFKIACFPVKIPGASAGWVRPVAIV